jgi:hypothetical protein
MVARMIHKVALFVCLATPLVSVGCKGGAEHPKVVAGEMPEGGTWRGVYYSPTYGSLHLVEDGDTVSGKWRTTGGEAWGELEGKADGDLLRYDWTEHKIGLVGPSATSQGKGYFKYIKPANGVDPDEIRGEWGLGDSQFGNPWTATRQNNVQPDPNSIKPDELEGRFSGGDWDDSGEAPPPTDDEGSESDSGESEEAESIGD